MTARPRTTPRKRALQDRSKATVDAILAATARILVKDGYDHASTNRIAEAAGVSVGSLYQYFPGKEALVAALIERHIEEMEALVGDSLVRLQDTRLEDAARELVRAMIDAHALDPKLHKVLVEQIPRVGRLERIHDIEAQAIALSRAYLDDKRAELREVDLDLASFIVVYAVEALTHAAVLTRPELLRDARFADEVAALVVRYLRADDASARQCVANEAPAV